MFLIPFIYKKKENIYPTHLFNIFLNKGTLFLQVEETEIDSFCKENQLYYLHKNIYNNYCFLEIDTVKTCVQEFYTYFENSQAECWRRFILIGDFTEDFLHVNSCNPEFINEILKDILRFKNKCVY